MFFRTVSYLQLNFKRSLSDCLVRLALLVLSHPLSELRSFANSVKVEVPG